MGSDTAVVYIIDTSISTRDSLERSLVQHGCTVEAYQNAETFLENFCAEQVACLVLDMRLPGMNGMDLQAYLLANKIILPIIFVTGHPVVSVSVRAIKAGAIDVLEKPCSFDTLLRRVDEALALCKKQLAKVSADRELISRFESLSRREHDVMSLLVANPTKASSKELASELNISSRTVNDHRSRVMAKMQAKSVAELVEMAKTCGVHVEENLKHRRLSWQPGC